MATREDPKLRVCSKPDDPIQFLFELQQSIHIPLQKTFPLAERRALKAGRRVREYPGEHEEGA
jgi:hypothetical protein